eukprot:562373-Pyramimonas_sp.AAC.1
MRTHPARVPHDELRDERVVAHDGGHSRLDVERGHELAELGRAGGAADAPFQLCVHLPPLVLHLGGGQLHPSLRDTNTSYVQALHKPPNKP